jgi:hypothetical protein
MIVMGDVGLGMTLTGMGRRPRDVNDSGAFANDSQK